MSDFIDDMPIPPAQAVPQGSAADGGPEIDGSASPEDMEGVATMGEAIPAGTFHFRLEKFTEGWGEALDDNKQPLHFGDGSVVDKQPYFMLDFVCQQEPHVGRRFGEFAPWVSQSVRVKAKAGDKVARGLLQDRLWKFKSIMDAAGFKPTAAYDLKKDFLSTHPEIKIQLGIQEGKTKINGKYVPDGSTRNKSVRYISLNRPA